MTRRGALLVAWGLGMVTAGVIGLVVPSPARVTVVVARASTVGRVLGLLRRHDLVEPGPVPDPSRRVTAGVYVFVSPPLSPAAAAGELAATATKR